MKDLNSNKGFTLLETIIALALLAILALASSQSIQSSMKSKKKIQHKIDRQSLVRDALAVMKRDIERAFNYYDFNAELYNETQKERIANCEKNNKPKTPKPGVTTPAPGTTTNPCTEMKANFKEKKLVSLTQFLGDSDSLHFTSSSNIRAQVDTPESNLAEVGYYIDSCKSRRTRKSVSKCLWRRTIAYIDDDVKKDGSKTVLIENIDRFELKYIGVGLEEGEWRKAWATDESGDNITKDTFPLAVEITVGVKQLVGRKKKEVKYAMTVVAPIRFPNNIKKEKSAAAAKAKANAAAQKQPGAVAPGTAPTTPTGP